ncbi:hypothetical protein ASH00_13895 [Arthrobacter sp. Soil782]|nr:hypothetical protein ASH00_13895 [Arthrobacter sp. Soil782]
MVETGAVAVISALLAAVVGPMITANADREAERRQQVSEHYSTYLEAANAYFVASQFFVGSLETMQVQDESEQIRRMQPAAQAVEQARIDYHAAANNVYAFGSEEAWLAHEQVLATLPEKPEYAQARTIDPGEPDEFLGAHNIFLAVFCKEAVATPRTNCDRLLER